MGPLLIGYARVSTDDQDLTAQRDALAALGVGEERIYVDHGLTGTNRERAGLREAFAACRAGDTLVVTKLDRLARSLPDAREILEHLTTREVKLSLGGSVHDPTDPVGRLLFNVLAMVAEFEADLTRLRTREGMKVAKAKGRPRGKRPKLNRRQEAHLVDLHNAGEHSTADATRGNRYRKRLLSDTSNGPGPPPGDRRAMGVAIGEGDRRIVRPQAAVDLEVREMVLARFKGQPGDRSLVGGLRTGFLDALLELAALGLLEVLAHDRLPDDREPAVVGLGEVALDPGDGVRRVDDGRLSPRDLDRTPDARESIGLVGARCRRAGSACPPRSTRRRGRDRSLVARSPPIMLSDLLGSLTGSPSQGSSKESRDPESPSGWPPTT